MAEPEWLLLPVPADLLAEIDELRNDLSRADVLRAALVAWVKRRHQTRSYFDKPEVKAAARERVKKWDNDRKQASDHPDRGRGRPPKRQETPEEKKVRRQEYQREYYANKKRPTTEP
jgi:hypothetical protein